jgi:gliding motility-associated-like protein
LTITDSNGCQASDNLILSNPSQLIPTIVSNPVTCGISGGSAIISIIGGLTPYQYSWSNGFNGTNPQNLDPQTYTVTISDNNSCTIVSTCNIGITGNIPIQIIQPQEILCPGDNTASLSATTSSVNVPMSWIWSTGSQNSSISNLFTGQYNVSVTDSWGCTGTTTWAIEEPELLTTTFNLQNINCRGYNNGRISCSTSGGTEPYSYLWVTGTSGSVLDNLVAGTYSVTTTDNNGCTTSDSGNIMEPSVELAVSTVASNASCFGEDDAKIYSNATGGTPPYSYTWQHLQHLFNVANIYSAFAGNYYLTVTDSENCAAFASVTISEPAQLSLTTEAINPSCTGNNNGEITVYAEGGSAPYSYSWNNGISQLNLISNLIEGNYNITVTDAFGCDMTTGIVELADVDIDCIKIPNAFTPNSDGPNDTWIIEGIGLFPSAEIMVFNRWGQKLFQARGDEEAWDGTYKNKPVPTGPYLYIIQLFNRNESYTGIVTVVY